MSGMNSNLRANRIIELLRHSRSDGGNYEVSANPATDRKVNKDTYCRFEH
jgi:hypothetical protein